MHYALGQYEALLRIQADGSSFEVDDELTGHYIKKLIIVVMFVPVIIALHHAEADD